MHREIEDTILLALHSPEVYDDIAHGTRRKFESNRPRAVLFEGPPGSSSGPCLSKLCCFFFLTDSFGPKMRSEYICFLALVCFSIRELLKLLFLMGSWRNSSE